MLTFVVGSVPLVFVDAPLVFADPFLQSKSGFFARAERGLMIDYGQLFHYRAALAKIIAFLTDLAILRESFGQSASQFDVRRIALC